MAYDAKKNFAQSLIATAPSPASSGTSLVVTAGTGTKFPAVPFNATIWPINSQPTTANAEIVRVTNIATDTFTITRTQESTSARTVVIGDQIAATITVKSLTDIEVPLGALDLSTATAGQIIFPAAQNSSAGVNTLDDYEEGTWTPVIGGSGGTSGQTYTTQVGNYIKIGKLVIAQFTVTLSAKGTITTNVQIQGLPFTAENIANSFWASAVNFNNLATNWISVVVVVTPNTTTADVKGSTAAATGNSTNLATADISNTTAFNGIITFRATA